MALSRPPSCLEMAVLLAKLRHDHGEVRDQQLDRPDCRLRYQLRLDPATRLRFMNWQAWELARTAAVDHCFVPARIAECRAVGVIGSAEYVAHQRGDRRAAPEGGRRRHASYCATSSRPDADQSRRAPSGQVRADRLPLPAYAKR